MPRGHPLHRDFVAALRLLDAVDLPYAEMWRKLAPVAASRGLPRPSYHCVRAFLIAERRRKLARAALLDLYVADAYAMRGPMRFLNAVVEYNTSGEATVPRRAARRAAREPPRAAV